MPLSFSAFLWQLTENPALLLTTLLLLGVLLVWQLDRMGDRRERKGKA